MNEILSLNETMSQYALGEWALPLHAAIVLGILSVSVYLVYRWGWATAPGSKDDVRGTSGEGVAR
ncbi:MAG: hypothetical protein ACREYE_31660 [Gammaproteobacteria bacterium]